MLRKRGLWKSRKFRDHVYLGDPINAVRIFNDLKADELVFLDIDASREGRCITHDFVRQVGEEASMPFAVGGGIRNLGEIKRLIATGAEKVVIGTFAAEKPGFIREAAREFGTSTLSVCMDVKRNFWGSEKVFVRSGRKGTGITPLNFAQKMEENGAGEIIVQSIERDGTMQGYDLAMIRSISEVVSIPVIALGGAGKMEHLKQAYTGAFATGLAAGSLFVFKGSRNSVLINYPENTESIFY